MNKDFIHDDNGTPCFLGDILESKWGYRVIIRSSEIGLYGELICDPSHSCANIPYHLNNGIGYTKVNDD